MKIEFNTTEFVFEHGHSPRGVGQWAFRLGHKDGSIVWVPGALSFTEAKKQIRAIARVRGVSTLLVCP